ncbi:hypothetical protein B0I35DRAFT_168716 [Stachybotrys elegans]|uniref:Uncharacterized protein n=1 Tax=Stachybotrys elegans TaxID=80388 RepID=A0A8K0SXP8_9HYPO|nr:hypothetical protein B0I35DRAFT_168716 [Stachybotrys elegans]
MLTNTASRISPRARVLRNGAITPSPLRTTNFTSIPSLSGQQSRTFRLGVWAYVQSHSGPRPRHGLLRYKYMNSITRRLSWNDKSQPAGDLSASIKEAMEDAIKSAASGTHYSKVSSTQSWPGDLSGARPGHNIEDVERDAIDHLFRHESPPGTQNSHGFKSSFRNLRNLLHADRVTSTSNVESFIDPITNRRVMMADSDSTDAAKYTAVHWNEPSGKLEPTSEEKSKEYKDLPKYSTTKTDNPNAPRKLTPEEQSKKYHDLADYSSTKADNPNTPRKLTQEEESKKYEDLNQYKSVKWNEPDGLPSLTPEEESKNYDDLDKYEKTKIDNLDTPRKLTPEEESKNYDDLHKYNALRWNEPDGLREPTAEEKSKDYDDLHQYGPVTWNEPDGLKQPTAEERSKNYKDLSEYGPVVWSEPDGLRRLTSEEQSKDYDDLASYTKPFVAKDSILAAHEATQQDTTVKGQVLPPKAAAPVHDPSKEYLDLSQYGPVRWNEPDGLRKLTPEELSKNYDDLESYGGAVRWNEPDGLRPPTLEEKSKEYADLPGYAAEESPAPEIIPTRQHPEEVSKQYADLKGYEKYGNKGAEVSRVHPEEASKQYKDLNKYAADAKVGPLSERIHPEEASKKYTDLSKYPLEGSQELNLDDYVHPEELSKNYGDLNQYAPKKFDSPSKAYKAHPEELTQVYDDLDQYEPQSFDSPTQAYPTHPEEATKIYKDLNRYGAIQHSKTFGKPMELPDLTPIGTNPYASKDQLQPQREPSPTKHCPNKANMDPMDALTADDIRSAVLRRGVDEGRKVSLAQAKSASEASWETSMENAQEALKQRIEGGSKLTGNYIRDFPEDFAKSWSTVKSSTGAVLSPYGAAGVGASETGEETGCDDWEPSSLDESFPADKKTTLEPALDRPWSRKTRFEMGHREKLQAMMDPYSTAPQGLETSYQEECAGKPTWPTFERHFSAKPKEEAQKEPSSYSEREEVSDGEPVSYRILAFNEATQGVEVAEMHSCVVGSSSPLWPADALARLSQPSLYLSHLTPLMNDGYEIVSGNSSMLVLRKLREAVASHSSDPTTISSPPRINPVDMMGKPVTGNFASPTGFVNYDTIAGEDLQKPAPPFRSAPNANEEHTANPHEQQAHGGTNEGPQLSQTSKRDRRTRGGFFSYVKWTAGGVAVLTGVSTSLAYLSAKDIKQVPRPQEVPKGRGRTVEVRYW